MGLSVGARTVLFLDIRGSRLLRLGAGEMEPTTVLVSEYRGADGVAVDDEYVYWTSMGRSKDDDGAVLRARLGTAVAEVVVPKGGTHTPKQIQVDSIGGKLYWSDREGMRVMRSNLDGSGVETLVTIAEGDEAREDAANWAVGVAVDREKGYVYWSQKGPTDAGRGSIRRAALAMPGGEDSHSRSDIEVIFGALPEPIDLDIDPTARLLYWTDRGDNTVNRTALDVPAGSERSREILVEGLEEAIGIVVDPAADRLYYTDLGGNLGTARLDGSESRTLVRDQGALTGITRVVD